MFARRISTFVSTLTHEERPCGISLLRKDEPRSLVRSTLYGKQAWTIFLHHVKSQNLSLDLIYWCDTLRPHEVRLSLRRRQCYKKKLDHRSVSSPAQLACILPQPANQN